MDVVPGRSTIRAIVATGWSATHCTTSAVAPDVVKMLRSLFERLADTLLLHNMHG